MKYLINLDIILHKNILELQKQFNFVEMYNFTVLDTNDSVVLFPNFVCLIS